MGSSSNDSIFASSVHVASTKQIRHFLAVTVEITWKILIISPDTHPHTHTHTLEIDRERESEREKSPPKRNKPEHFIVFLFLFFFFSSIGAKYQNVRSTRQRCTRKWVGLNAKKKRRQFPSGAGRKQKNEGGLQWESNCIETSLEC